jgi:hypothetical protein
MTRTKQTCAKARNNRKVCHVPLSAEAGAEILELPIDEIFPTPENDGVYHPFSMTNHDDSALAESIKVHGILEPITITLDSYVLSGHRRLCGARHARLKTVPCRQYGILRSDPAFLPLLAQCNRQRNKSFDEIVHETILAANPEEAHRELQDYREMVSSVSADTIEIEGSTCRKPISRAKKPMLDAICRIVKDMMDYWPVTDRQVHYQLLNDPPLIHASKPNSHYRNDLKSYKALCELITRARLEGRIPFQTIHDPTRATTTWNVHSGVASYVSQEVDGFLKGYFRNLQASQPCHIEILAEKLTVQSILNPVAGEFCIPLTIGRGYSSIPPRYEMSQRFRRSGKSKLVLLIVSDFDPEGQDIAHSFARSMRDDFGVQCIDAAKVALTSQQVEDLQLSPMMTAKEGSSRRKKFTDEYGEHVYELEAIAPETLQRFLRDAIGSVLDADLFNMELEAEKDDAAKLAGMRVQVYKALERLVVA